MSAKDVREIIGEYLKKKLESGDLNWDRVEEIATFVDSQIKDDLSDDEIKKIVPTLDDDFKELNGVILQLIAQ